MSSYRELYFHLFGIMARATELLEEGKVLPAMDLLITAQQQAEEVCLETDLLPDK